MPDNLETQMESRQESRASSKTMDTQSSVSVGNLLPMVVVTTPSTMMHSKSRVEAWAREELHDDEEVRGVWSRGLLSPKWAGRAIWDVAWCFFCALELCFVPFQIVFTDSYGGDLTGRAPRLESQPLTKPVATLLLITIFFGIDFFVNLSTGYEKDGTLVMRRQMIVRQYLRSWFLIDLIAWVPVDMIMTDMARINSFVRVLRIPIMAMKVSRANLLNDVPTFRGKKIMLRDTFETLTYVWKIILTLAALCFVVHLHACVWTAISSTREERKQNVSYVRAYCEALLALTGMSPLQWYPTAPSLAILAFEVLLAVERVLLVYELANLCMGELAIRLSNESLAMSQVKESALKYLKQNAVSVETQAYVMNCLSEIRSVNIMKQHFNQVSAELPPSLNRQICKEMWEPSLVTLQLIRHISAWSEDFLPQLVTLVQEEMIPCKMILFEKDGTSHDAFHVLQGALHSPDDPRVADFTEDQWVGETSLINPSLCSGLTIATKTLCRLMVVPARDFHELIQTLDIQAKFSEFCQSNLFRGICGRCGVFGDHMSSECPLVLSRKEEIQNTLPLWGRFVSRPTRELTPSRELCRDLKEFLRKHELERLTPSLLRLQIYNTDELLDMASDLDILRKTMQECSFDSGNDEELEEVRWLEDFEEQALSAKNIQRFQQKLYATIKRTVYHDKIDVSQHLVFLSHYKMEAGTEASLMRSEMLQAMDERDHNQLGKLFHVPVFLDSEDLQDLASLKRQVLNSHNVALFLTEDVLTRPWCLLEVVIANQFNVSIIPVEVIKPGSKFAFPDQKWYDRLSSGRVLTRADMEVLSSYGVGLPDVEQALREAFKKIAVPYSPHRSADIRRVEVQALLQRCVVCDDLNARNTGAENPK